MNLSESDIRRFWSKVSRQDPDECWPWTAGLTDKGYGQFTYRVKGKAHTVRSHKVAWVLLRGPFPIGLLPDHLCRRHDCSNPFHLEPVTGKENVLRGEGRTAINARKTECLRGHEFTDANTRIAVDGSRQCRSCQTIRSHAERKRIRHALKGKR